MAAKQPTKEHKIGRDSGTGQFVTPGYVKSHPKTTTTETIKPNPQKPPAQPSKKKGK